MGFCVVQVHGGSDGSSVGIVYRMITQVDREVGKVVLPLVVDQAVVAWVVEPLGGRGVLVVVVIGEDDVQAFAVPARDFDLVG